MFFFFIIIPSNRFYLKKNWNYNKRININLDYFTLLFSYQLLEASKICWKMLPSFDLFQSRYFCYDNSYYCKKWYQRRFLIFYSFYFKKEFKYLHLLRNLCYFCLDSKIYFWIFLKIKFGCIFLTCSHNFILCRNYLFECFVNWKWKVFQNF